MAYYMGIFIEKPKAKRGGVGDGGYHTF